MPCANDDGRDHARISLMGMLEPEEFAAAVRAAVERMYPNSPDALLGSSGGDWSTTRLRKLDLHSAECPTRRATGDLPP